MSLFGPSRDDVWRELSREIGAEFIAASFWKGRECKVRAHIGPWTVTLETGFSNEEDAGVTRLCAPFLNPEGFHFTVYRRVFLNNVGQLLGTLRDIKQGDPEFDGVFIIQSKDDLKVRALLAVPEIRRLMLAQAKIRVVLLPAGRWFGPKYLPGVDELQLQVVGKVKDIVRLRQMFKLVAVLLDRLCEIGVTRRESPEATVQP